MADESRSAGGLLRTVWMSAAMLPFLVMLRFDMRCRSHRRATTDLCCACLWPMWRYPCTRVGAASSRAKQKGLAWSIDGCEGVSMPPTLN